MQKAFTWLERVLVGVAAIGFVLILFSTTGGPIMVVLGLAFLSLLYFVGGYFQPAKAGQKNSAKLALVKIASGFTLSILVIGLLFKFMLWNGAAIMLLAGLGSTAIVAIAAIALTFAEYSMVSVLRRIAIWVGLGVVLFLTNTTTLFEIHHPNDSVMIDKFRAKEAHPGDPIYQADFDDYRRQQQAQQHTQ
ncbi:hypothetical protein [Hymenobacter ruber]